VELAFPLHIDTIPCTVSSSIVPLAALTLQLPLSVWPRRLHFSGGNRQ